MALDKLALIIVIAGAIIWAFLMLVGMIAAWPVGLPFLVFGLIAGYFLYRVIADRLSNAEDDYYEKNVDR